MSAPVDVLAVLSPRSDRIIPGHAFRRDVSGLGRHHVVEVGFTGTPRDTALVDVHDLDEARAAIAELIEADKEYDAAQADLEVVRAYKHYPKVYAERESRLAAAKARRAAALRAVGGVK